MAVAIAIWNLELVPGKEEVVVPEADARISNAALGATLADQDGRTVIKVTYTKHDSDEEDEEDEPSSASFILCALTAGKIENAQVNLILDAGASYKFNLIGKNPVSLSGNYIDQLGPDQPPFSQAELDSDEEDAYDLRDVSSDVEVDPEELDDVDSDTSRFEEVEEEKEVAKPGKRAREADDTEKESKPAKADKKNKKLKKENGEAVLVGKDDAKPLPTEKKEKKEKKEKTDKGDKELKELPGGLKYQDATIGTGAHAKKGDKLQMRYVGKLLNGKVFDKNTKGKPFNFRLGAGDVIKGWDQGLVGMQVGGERTLTCPPNLAYGKRGSPPEIPPDSTLLFEVKLLSIN